MKSPIVTTLMMLVLAAVASLAAAFYYPWPEPVVSGERVNQLLFEDFGQEFKLDSVRGIKIVKFNDDRNELQDIQIRRRREKWILPNKGNFVLTNLRQITDVGSSLTDKKIREVMSDKQEDHIKFGVVDPGSYASAVRSSLGTKLLLEDRQGKELASLIVGKPVKSDSSVSQRFVRIPDQPHVYVIDFDANLLKTDIEDWISPNLLQLAAGEQAGQKPVSVRVENYLIDKDKIASAEKQYRYKARFGGKGLEELEIPQGDSFEKVDVDRSTATKLISWARVLQALPVSDVRRKSKELIKALRQSLHDYTDPMNKELNTFGFRKVGDEGFPRFDGAGGMFQCKTSAGLRMDVYIGNFDTGGPTSKGSLARYVMIVASVDESLFPEPEKPADASEEDRAYLRAVAERDKRLKNAKLLARELNRVYSDWFYVINQETLESLVPDVKITPVKSVDAPPSGIAAPPEEN